MTGLRKFVKRQSLIVGLVLGFLMGVTLVSVHPARAALEYGTEYPDIGTFTNTWGNWTFWIGWDANFSETYIPEGESYAWVVYFAPEAVYLALQSSKSVYSGVNVNAGYKKFYGVLNQTSNRLSATVLSNELHSVGLSKNLFSASASGIGVGALGIGNLSFAYDAGLTFMKEKGTGKLKRGIQVDQGLSLSYDLIALPLPFSVSLGTDCVFTGSNPDPSELCKFHGFYPLIIWNIAQQASQNPVETVIAELQANTPASPSTAADVTRRALLNTLQILKNNTELKAFMESVGHDSTYDSAITETQQWLDSGDTSNLPTNVNLPDPATAQVQMKPIYATTQMAFELGYLLGCQSNPTCASVWDDCVVTVNCTAGQECSVEIPASELVKFASGSTVADFEGSWLLIDNPVEQYLISKTETEEWIEVVNGKATYTFSQNTNTPVFLGLRIDPAYSPVTQWVHPCSRAVNFNPPPPILIPPTSKSVLAPLFLLLNNTLNP